MNSQVTNQINQVGHLTIGGVDSIDLAREYGTPLVVYDVNQIRHQIRAFKKVFEEEQVDYAVSYASKAFAAIAMYQVASEEGASTDVVSAGELYTALKAGFPMERVSFHGNNKSKAELEMAVKNHVGKIMIDNFYEIDLLNEVLEKKIIVRLMSCLELRQEFQLILMNMTKPVKLIANLVLTLNLVKQIWP